MMSGKVGTFSKQNGICKRLLFYYEGFVYQASELWPMLSTNKWVVHAEDTICYRDYMCQVSKLQHMYVTDLILLSVLKTTKHTRLYPATRYCTRLQGTKERIV